MAKLELRKGTKVRHAGEMVVIVAMQGFNVAIVRTDKGELLDVPVDDLLQAHPQTGRPVRANDPIRMEKVPAYVNAFKSLLGKRTRRDEVTAAGKGLGIGVSAAYEALARYRLSGKAADLPPPTKNGGRNRPRVNAKVEEIIQDRIERQLLKRGNPDINAFKKDVRLAVEKVGLSVAVTTLSNRVAAIPRWKWTSRRSGYDEADKTLAPHVAGHPGCAAPLTQIQCDHWKTDIEILGDDRLDVIGRASATIAIDVHSRAVWGMYVGLEDPSTTTVGLAMINGFLHKEPMLRSMGIETSMPIYGKPRELLLDNAAEFTGASIKASADHFGIDLTWRPVNKPQFGAHIERLNGTLAKKFRSLPGATGASAKERKAFRPGATAAFTLDDLRKQMWLMVDEYHNEPHLGIDAKTPLAAWSGHFFGPNGATRPPPAAWADDDDLRIPWYPLECRSIQRYGIEIDYLFYYNESIEHLVRNYRSYRSVTVRRHPLDVRRIYLLHPVQNVWTELSCRTLGLPATSLVEMRSVKKEARKTSRKPTPERLREIIERRKAHIEEAKAKSKTAARANTRRADEERRRKAERTARSKGVPAAKPATPPASTTPTPGSSLHGGFQTPPDFGTLLADLRNGDIEEMFSE